MTLIVSMRAKYGAVILADSQETVQDYAGNEFKYSVPKSEPESVRGFHFVITGGGDGEAIDELIEEFRRNLIRSSCRTLDGFREIFERCLKAQLNSLKKKYENKELMVPGLELIVGAGYKDKWEVWTNNRGKLLIKTRSDRPTLVGFDAVIYKRIAYELFPHAVSTTQIVLAGLRILELATESSTCVNRPYLGVVVGPGAVIPMDEAVLAELAQSITLFRSSLDRLLLACGDTSVGKAAFSKSLEEFKKHALHLRNDYLQSVVEKDFLARWNTGIPSSIPLLPKGAIMTASYGSIGKFTVSVKEPAASTPPASQKPEPEQAK